jgi:sec-independent protein translocase protein TatA
MGLDNPVHILLLLLVVLLVFGARRLPEIGRSLGTGLRDFRTSLTGESARLDAPPVPAAHAQAAEQVEALTSRS